MQQATRAHAKQAKLFEAAKQGPQWADFPSEIRGTVTALFARMLRRQRNLETASVTTAEVERE